MHAVTGNVTGKEMSPEEGVERFPETGETQDKPVLDVRDSELQLLSVEAEIDVGGGRACPAGHLESEGHPGGFQALP